MTFDEEHHHKLTLEALANVDAGRVIDHQNIQAWANSLTTDSPLPPPVPAEEGVELAVNIISSALSEHLK